MKAFLAVALVVLLATCAVAIRPALWARNNRYKWDEPEADAEEFSVEKLIPWLERGKTIYELLKKGDDFQEETDLEVLDKFKTFLTNAKNWFKSKLTGKPTKTTTTDEAETMADAESESSQLCTTTSLNVRATPCTNGSLKKTLPPGTKVTQTGGEKTACGYTWVQISDGWVAKQYLKTCSDGGGSTGGSFDCGLAYVSGNPQGRKQCVRIDGKPVVVETANAFNVMKAAAAKDGVSLKINSGFRTQAEQEYFYNCYVTKKCNNGNLAAKPGYSNHQNGIALDISVPSNVYNWLAKNASKYGFVRTVSSETWHWELRRGAKCNQFVSYSCQ